MWEQKTFNMLENLKNINRKEKNLLKNRLILKNYKITKRLQLSSILNDLKLNQSLIKDINDQNQSIVSNFKIRLGRHRKIMYTVPRGLTFIQKANCFILWEFIRIVRMAEEKDVAFVSSLNRLHKARFSKLTQSFKK
jgi:hypothetical protein